MKTEHIATELPGPKAKALLARDAKVVSPSYPRDYPFVMSHGRGCEVWDVDGNRFLDFASGIAVCATDAPLDAQQLRRLALRPLLGLARTGSYGGEGSGEIGVAFSVAEGGPPPPYEELNPYFAAAFESAHEAVYNCLLAARPAQRLDGSTQDAFPVDLVARLARERRSAGQSLE